MVKGDAGDEVKLVDGGWVEIVRASMDGVDLSNYTVWEHNASLATLYLAPNVAFDQPFTIVFPPLELA